MEWREEVMRVAISMDLRSVRTRSSSRARTEIFESREERVEE